MSGIIARTGRTFKARRGKHTQAIKANRTNSKYAQHILEPGHSYRPIENTLEILHLTKIDKYMNTVENFHIYNVSR
jgi:hypothetical protein